MIRFITTILCLAFVEFFLKSFFPVFETGIKSAYEFDSKVGVKLKTGYTTQTTDYKQEFIANKYGTVNPNENFEDYSKIIFAIGDSFTKGVGVPMDSSYPLQLDLSLNIDKQNNYKLSYAVVNLGVSSLGGLQYIEMYKKYSEILGKPDYLLYLGSNNDYTDDILFKNGYRHSHLVSGNPNYGILLKPLILLSELEIGKRLKIILGNFKYNLYERELDPQVTTNKQCIPVATKQLDNIKYFIKEANEKNIDLILSWQDDSQVKCSSYLWLKKWALENNIKFADWVSLYSQVSPYWENMPKNNDHSSGHYRSWINNLISRSFMIKILENPSN